jgi:hypothetical protein
VDDQPAPSARGPVDPSTHRRHRLAVALTAVVALAAGVGLGLGVDGSMRSDTRIATVSPVADVAPATPSFLYVVEGTTGSATRSGAATWRLRLSSPSVLWFVDRPATGSGKQSAESLVAAWPQTFAGSPPNAAVLAPDGPPGHHPTAVSVTDPSYDPVTGTASFTLTAEKDDTAVATWLDGLAPGAEADNGRVVLFVDDGVPATLPPGTYQYRSPAQASTIVFTLAGAAGGGGGGPDYDPGVGGLGGEVQASVEAPANTSYQIVIGAPGGLAQGGGATAVYAGACAASLACGPSDRILVAGGGGGAGMPSLPGGRSEGDGGAGSGAAGTAGVDGYARPGQPSANLAGGGGTPSGGGQGGAGDGGTGGQGGFGSGGAGGAPGGGGGGGGYYTGGGGGGYCSCTGVGGGGGGGGGGYVAPSLTTLSTATGTQSGAGAARITSVTPAIALSSSANPLPAGRSVTYTATVSPAPPGGAISFLDGTTPIAGCTGLAVSASAASVTCPVTYPGVGSHAITASYTGVVPFRSAVSAALTQTIQQGAPATTTSLVSSANPATAGAAITYTATVSPAPDGGTVDVTANGTALPGCAAVAVRSGVATCVAAYAPGSYTVIAAYSGDASYPASSSPPVAQTVGTGVTTTAISATANPADTGQQVTFAATVSPVPDGGTVTFTSGGTTLSGCEAVAPTGGVARCTTFYATAGSYPIAAAYSGTASYAASTAPVMTQTVTGTGPFG